MTRKLWIRQLGVGIWLSLGLGPAAEAADWGPPLHGPLRITGTFGEPRSGHLHTGLDLSTGREIGRPVLAIADGHVVRMRAKSGGYGRALYLQTDRGELVVVAHLDRFAPALERHLNAAQREAGEFEVDLYVADNRFRFARGDTLAFSGASGAGPAHLHVEIRRDGHPINPLILGLMAEDHNAPQLGPIRLRALSAESTVGKGELEDPAEVLSVWGEVGVEVAVIDRCGTSSARLSPLRMRLFLDEQLLFTRRFEQSDFARGAEVDRIYGRPFPENRTWVVRMYDWPHGASPDLAASGPTSGRIDFSALAAGEHHFCLEASDASGNAAEVTWTVIAQPPLLPLRWRTQAIPARGFLLGCRLSRPSPAALCCGEELYSTLALEDGWLAAFLPIEASPAVTLCTVEGDPLMPPMSINGSAFEAPVPESLQVEISEGLVLFDVRCAEAWPGIPRAELELARGGRIALASRGMTARGGWSFGLNQGDLLGGVKHLRLQAAGCDHLLPVEGLSGLWRDPLVFDEITVRPDAETFAAPTALRVRTEAWGGGAPDTLRPISAPISIEPEWWPLAAAMEIEFAPAALAADADLEKCALFRLDSHGEWVYEAPLEQGSARVGSCGRFAVLEDRTAPMVLETDPPDDVLLAASPVRLSATIAEIGCGFDPRAADIFLNGQMLLAEWDVDEERLEVRIDPPLRPGHHTWDVRILDRAGNTCEHHARFRIAPE